MNKKSKLQFVEVGTLGDITTPDMIRIHAYQDMASGKYRGISIDHCCSGGDQKPRTIMFDDLDTLVRIAEALHNKQEESGEL